MKNINDIIKREAIEEAYIKIYKQEINKSNNSALQFQLKQLINLYPHFAKPYVKLGWLQMLNKENVEAEINFKKGLALDPEYGIGYYYFLYFLIEIDRYEEAEKFIPICLKVRSINTRHIYEEWDCLLEQTKRIKEAIAIKKERIAKVFNMDILKALESEIIELKKQITDIESLDEKV